MKRNHFSADYTYTIEDNVIAIVDLKLGNRSVTNGMELVLDEIHAEVGDLAGYAVVYRDSTGRRDGVRLVNGVVYFYGLGEAEKDQATRRLLHLVES